MWQRFTERARRLVFSAQDAANELGHKYVSTEHFLLGLIKDEESVACRIIDRLGVSFSSIQSGILDQVPRAEPCISSTMELTPQGKRVIDLAYDEARGLSNNYI